jgi:hypothetical protein
VLPAQRSTSTRRRRGTHESQGVGDKRAQEIIDYRKKNGDFKSVDDLEKVPASAWYHEANPFPGFRFGQDDGRQTSEKAGRRTNQSKAPDQRNPRDRSQKADAPRRPDESGKEVSADRFLKQLCRGDAGGVVFFVALDNVRSTEYE